MSEEERWLRIAQIVDEVRGESGEPRGERSRGNACPVMDER
jgi:hypothetical protein